MRPRRVVVTGMGAISPFGRGVDILLNSLAEGRSAVRYLTELEEYSGLRCLVAAPVRGVDPGEIPRKHRRTMSAMSVYAVMAAREAIENAGLERRHCEGGGMGVAVGSSVGSPLSTQQSYSDFFNHNSLEQMRSTGFFQIMNHSCAANIAHALGINGRCLAVSSACSTSCQTVGYGYEMVAHGKQDFMVCGGAEEYHPLITATFDIMNAASVGFNNSPQRTPRPFDRDRDGIVCSEGGAVLLLEPLESAVDRGADILAEIIGFATLSDTSNMVNPSADSMEICMLEALKDAGVQKTDVDYVNAHATATELGDSAESEAISRLLGDGVPVSSFKGHLGHTMAASGTLEMIAAIGMMRRGCIIPTLNLENVDDSCAGVRHVRNLEMETVNTIIKNNFAFGGVNSSVVFRRYENG